MAKILNVVETLMKDLFFQGKPGSNGLIGKNGEKGEKVINRGGIEDILLHCRVKLGGEMQPWAPDFTVDQ